MLCAGLFTGGTFGTGASVGGAVYEETPSVVGFYLIEHFFFGSVEEGLFIVDLHVVCHRNVFRAALYAIAAAGAQAIHVFGDMSADAVDVFVSEGAGGVSGSAGGVDMLFCGKAHECYCYLRAVDAKSQRCLCWRFITVGKES